MCAGVAVEDVLAKVLKLLVDSALTIAEAMTAAV